MQNAERPSLAFRIALTNRGADMDLVVHVPAASGEGEETFPVKPGPYLLPFAALLLRYRITAQSDHRLSKVILSADDLAPDRDQFETARNFLKNWKRSHPRVEAGKSMTAIRGLLPKTINSKEVVEFDPLLLPGANIDFRLVVPGGMYYELKTHSELTRLLEFICGHCKAAALSATCVPAVRADGAFTFGGHSTGTFVAHRFPAGLTEELVRCELQFDPFAVPAELEPVVTAAASLLSREVPGMRQISDQLLLAPRAVRLYMEDLDDARTYLTMEFAQSSYRYYAAFAFSKLLAEYDRAFAPLADFVHTRSMSRTPQPGSCSTGVRVLLETADRRLLVAHRSAEVKMNPDVWSTSANEGLRRSLFDARCSDEPVMATAAYRAVHNELHVPPRDCTSICLLSLYHNAYAQWGATFWATTALSSGEVIRRQHAAGHAFEHRRMASLPIKLEECGQAMRELGPRWYGGALESLCTVLSARERLNNRFIEPEEVGRLLSESAGEGIVPVDEPNCALLPTPPSGSTQPGRS